MRERQGDGGTTGSLYDHAPPTAACVALSRYAIPPFTEITCPDRYAASSVQR